MNKIYYLFMSMTVILLAACSQDEVEQVKEDTPALLKVMVNQSAQPSTRASVDGRFTYFEAGDQIGLFAVDEGSGQLIYINVPYTYNGTTWEVSNPEQKVYFSENFKYFAYYPYQERIEDEEYSSDEDDTIYWHWTLSSYADDASEFFGYLISNWEPQLDQSTLDSYNASDLMVGKGTNNNENASVSFTMDHQMGLLLFELYSDAGGPINAGDLNQNEKYFDDYFKVDMKETFYSVPYNDGTYFRYIGKPGEDYTFSYNTSQTGNGEFFYTLLDERGMLIRKQIYGLQVFVEN